ncbi:MAG: divalent-cation tolerance protein CutA [Actinomycetota bacterium]
MDYNLVYVTTANQEEARRIGRTLVEKRLAACVNIIPIVQSIYWWKGKIYDEEEALMFVKTTKERVEEVIAEVKKLHSYEVPAIDVLDISAGNPDYLNWISKEVK